MNDFLKGFLKSYITCGLIVLGVSGLLRALKRLNYKKYDLLPTPENENKDKIEITMDETGKTISIKVNGREIFDTDESINIEKGADDES
jgi:hypothetical protein